MIRSLLVLVISKICLVFCASCSRSHSHSHVWLLVLSLSVIRRDQSYVQRARVKVARSPFSDYDSPKTAPNLFRIIWEFIATHVPRKLPLKFHQLERCLSIERTVFRILSSLRYFFLVMIGLGELVEVLLPSGGICALVLSHKWNCTILSAKSSRAETLFDSSLISWRSADLDSNLCDSPNVRAIFFCWVRSLWPFVQQGRHFRFDTVLGSFYQFKRHN